DPVLKGIKPTESDPDYAYIECANGKTFALSLSGAANIAGYVPEGDYARGNVEAARRAWKPIADGMGISVEEAAALALELSAKKNAAVVKALMEDYNMNTNTTILVGGGGGASSVVPHLAKSRGLKSKNAENAPVISTIGVALAMVRDMVERTIPNPTNKDILAVRREVEEKIIAFGANPESVEVTVEVDASKNLVRATAIGTTELRSKDLANRRLDIDSVRKLVAEDMDVQEDQVQLVAGNGTMYAMQYKKVKKRLFGLIKSHTKPTRIVDEEGVIRLRKEDGHLSVCNGTSWRNTLPNIVEANTDYTDSTKNLPNIYVIFGKRIIDLSGLESLERVMSLADVEL
ncbi:MAG: hydantoinase/oxoprolinase family protein, partial [Lawsonibacter sp.]